MNIQLALTCLLVMTALASYINHRLLKFPSSVGVTLITLLIALGLLIIDHFNLPLASLLQPVLTLIDLNTSFINPDFFISVVCFLLFASGLHLCIIELAKQKSLIAVLTTVGVMISTFIIGTSLWYISQWSAVSLSYPYCLVFGALISPTDPIAVLGMLKQVNAPKTLSLRIAGESLFNDGIGIVLFVALLRLARGHDVQHHVILSLLAQEIIGGIALGASLGLLGNQLLKHVTAFHVSFLITLALVMSGYVLATSWHISAPIALTIAGLVIGYKLKQGAMSPMTAKSLQAIWEMIDDVLNAILFVVIGLVVLHLNLSHGALYLGLAAIPIVLLARLISVAIPVYCFRHVYHYSPHMVKIMTWGGLRGGVSIALALSLPLGPEKQIILSITYAVVLFSILVQGMSVKALLQKTLRQQEIV